MKNASQHGIHARNKAIERAFLSLLKAVKSLISEQPGEYERTVVELDHRKGCGTNWSVYEMTSPQFYLLLEQDEDEHYRISFGIDQRMDRSLNIRFLRLVFRHTRRTRAYNIEDCLCLDQIFMNTGELFAIAARKQPMQYIDILEFDFQECFLRN
jgi:hypothetical protein